MPRPDKKKEVKKAFLEGEGAMTTGEIADKACTSRKTAKKWINKLLDKGIIEETRKVGNISFYQLESSIRLSNQDAEQENTANKVKKKE